MEPGGLIYIREPLNSMVSCHTNLISRFLQTLDAQSTFPDSVTATHSL